MLEWSLRIKDQLKLSSIVCVYDQSVYGNAKAFQIKCKEPSKFHDIFLMMGTFHVIPTFLAVIAARLKDAGIGDIAVQSLIVAEGSVDTRHHVLRLSLLQQSHSSIQNPLRSILKDPSR